MPISDKSQPLTTDVSTTESDEERMRRALADLGGEGQRARFTPSRPVAAGLGTPPAGLQPGQSGPRPRAAELGQPAPKWSQPNRPQLSSSSLQGGSGPRRNRFAGSADVPVVHLPLGPGRERGRSEPVALPEHQAATARPVVDDRPLREAQAKLDTVCSQLGLAELKLKDALELIRRQDADIAALQATVNAHQAELAATAAARAAPPSDRVDPLAASAREAMPNGQTTRKNPVGRPRGPAKTADAAARRKPAREPKPVKWWIKSS